jgi:hypothetical protein
MDEITALTILANTIDTCLNTELPAAEVFAALNFLAARVPVKWPFVEFRQAFDSGDVIVRHQILNSALAAIKLLLRARQR